MPSIRKKICSMHGVYEGNKCPECKALQSKQYDKTIRNKEASKFYHSSRWKKVREKVMKRDGGICQKCGEHRGTMIVDHIKELRDGGNALNADNLEVLCQSCHNTKTAEENMKRNK